MIRPFLITLILLCTIMMAGCSNPTAQTDPADLIGPVWTLRQVQIFGSSNLDTNNDQVYTMEFSTDGWVSGRYDCNTYDATYTIVGGDVIEIDMISITEIYCGDPPAYEQYFLFHESYTFEINDDSLRLLHSANGVVLIFTADV